MYVKVDQTHLLSRPWQTSNVCIVKNKNEQLHRKLVVRNQNHRKMILKKDKLHFYILGIFITCIYTEPETLHKYIKQFTVSFPLIKKCLTNQTGRY